MAMDRLTSPEAGESVIVAHLLELEEAERVVQADDQLEAPARRWGVRRDGAVGRAQPGPGPSCRAVLS